MKEKNIYLYTKMLKYEMIRYLIEIDPIKNYNDNNKTNKIYKINNKLNTYLKNNNYRYRYKYEIYELNYTIMYVNILFIEKYFDEGIIYDKYFYNIPKKLKAEIFERKNISLNLYSDAELEKYKSIPNYLTINYIISNIKKALIYGNNETQKKLSILKMMFNVNSNYKFEDLLEYGISKYYCISILSNILKNDKKFLIYYASENYVRNSNDNYTKIYEKYKKIQKFKNKLHFYIKMKYNIDLYDDILNIIKKFI